MTVPSDDWRRARAERRACERQLPAGLARDLRVLRRDDLGHDAALGILADVAAIAARDGEVRRVHSAESPPWSYVRAAGQRDVLRRLEQNPTYRRQVRARVRSTLRTEHLVKVDPGAVPLEVPDTLGDVPLAGDTLVVRSSIGLGTASMLESEPEAWNHWVAAQVRNEHRSDGLPDAGLDLPARTRRVLVLGALAGGFARAVTALDISTITVTEVDWVLPTATNLPCVEGRGLAEPMGKFHAAVAVFPSPATSAAANQRYFYGDAGDDLARLGARRWGREVNAYLALLNVALDIGGFAYVLLPGGLRQQRGYARAPGLLVGVVSALGRVGFEIVSAIPTIEVNPVAQPFVGRSRPPKSTLVLKKTAHLEGL